MGACCQKLESIDHVYNLYDVKYVVSNDIDLFVLQNRIITDDKELKEKKIEYFNYLISNLKIILKDLNDIAKFKEQEIIIFKEKYKVLMSEVSTQDQVKLENNFREVYDFLEKILKRNTSNSDFTEITPKQ